jgi:trimeric autotransporter adhesin
MTHSIRCTLMLAVALAATVESAHAQICTISDVHEDTACGTDALALGSTQGGVVNTAFGSQALQRNTGGLGNTASGGLALSYNTTGSYNTALGLDALVNNTTGSYNTATGSTALFYNTGDSNTATGSNSLHFSVGSNNTATGSTALYNNNGSYNTATGSSTLYWGYGSYNTATGGLALFYNVGSYNTATGANALALNSSGANNMADGYNALTSNRTGNYNNASGEAALYSNSSGDGNEASGHAALYSNTTGSYNLAVGYAAGYNQTTGSNNIYIGHRGVAAESGITRIGTPGTQTEVYVAGIENSRITGSAVYVTSTGALGVMGSSQRFKTDVATMPEASAKLSQLRPVTFRYKTDPKGVLQYGLIAEEVDKVYPELVLHDQAGKIEGVRYEELAPMLLKEVQKQQSRIAAQDAKIARLEQMNESMQAAMAKLLAKDDRVAMR